jgi:enoyl-CoA hydratase
MGAVVVRLNDGVGLIELNRPHARNAIDAGLAGEFVAALHRLQSEVAVVVVTGRDPAFCAGLDLRNLGTARLGEVPKCAAEVHAATVPVIGAINGPAVTAGLEIALACDILIASERASFADTHLDVQVYPGPVLVDLPRRVGRSCARFMSLTGDFVDAATALRIGLVDRVVAHSELVPVALATAARIARHDAAMVAAMRSEWDELEPLDIDAAHARHIENAQRLGFRGTTASHLSGTGARVLAERRGQAGTAGREPGQDA